MGACGDKGAGKRKGWMRVAARHAMADLPKPGVRRRLFSIPRTRNEMRWGWCSRLGQQLAPILPKCAVARGKIGTALGQAAVGDLLKVDWLVPKRHLAVGPFHRSHWVGWVQVRSGGAGEFPIRVLLLGLRGKAAGDKGGQVGPSGLAWGSMQRGASPLDQDGWTRSVGQMYL